MGGGLTNGYIETTGRKLLGHNFLGCYPADLQPEELNRNFSIIFNLSNHDKPGTHFVAINSHKNVLNYFDSLGSPCQNKRLKVFLTKHRKGKKYIYNKTKVQSNNSHLCGIYCLGFLLSQESDIVMKDFLKNFSKTNLMLNDKIILEFIKKITNVVE